MVSGYDVHGDTLPTGTRRGWETCPGGNAIGHRAGDRNMCRACGALFAAIPDGYVPRHDAPSVEAILEIMMEEQP